MPVFRWHSWFRMVRVAENEYGWSQAMVLPPRNAIIEPVCATAYGKNDRLPHWAGRRFQ